MRKKKEPQLNLLNLMPRNKIAQELEAIARLLDANQDILDLVYGDLVKYRRQDTGRNGMTAEQVLRCAILKQYRELTYEELAFHLDDSRACRSFARLEMGQYPSGSTLQDNISAIGAETWEAVNRALLQFAAQREIEKGRTVRGLSPACSRQAGALTPPRGTPLPIINGRPRKGSCVSRLILSLKILTFEGVQQVGPLGAPPEMPEANGGGVPALFPAHHQAHGGAHPDTFSVVFRGEDGGMACRFLGYRHSSNRTRERQTRIGNAGA
jgi:hypothetical protein